MDNENRNPKEVDDPPPLVINIQVAEAEDEFIINGDETHEPDGPNPIGSPIHT